MPNGPTHGSSFPNGNGGIGGNGGSGNGPGGGPPPGGNGVRLENEWLGDEDQLYKYKQLSTMDFGTLPKDAAENKVFVEYVRTVLGALDQTDYDFIIKWVDECLNLNESLMRLGSEEIWAVFHNNSGGLPILDKTIASKIMTPHNMQHSVFNLEFRQYQAWATQQQTSCRGRVLFALMSNRFRITISQGSQSSITAILDMKMEDYKIATVRNFVSTLKCNLARLQIGRAHV